ncbi:Major allergen Asp f 2 [Vanrija pseudolonga]|uniref:Major allergen Asp f 2 n=1 Tax=Vanrija pseudolonga TaxID=143232 RepID=A0AAF0YAQ4_9TREE|nr:Major allergen Asp f 2 [Vanrija pseudolonga]
MLALVALVPLLATTLASPINLVARNNEAYIADVEIHASCNATQRRMLTQALSDTWEVVTVAQDYIKHNGPKDDVFKLYFGDKPEAYPTALGVYEALLHSDKAGVVLRCDNPDGRCATPGYAGHWRGDASPSETVICDLSYEARIYNPGFCMFGFRLDKDKPSKFWSIDLIHRFYHVPQITNSAVNHYAANLAEVVQLSQNNSTFSPFDSDALQFFAAHVYALNIGAGDVCIGDVKNAVAPTTANAPVATPKPDNKPAPPPTPATTADNSCHTHADGAVHCEGHEPAAAHEPAPAHGADPNAGKECHSHADGSLHCV